MIAKLRPTTKHETAFIADLYEPGKLPRWAVDLRGKDGVIGTSYFKDRIDGQLCADKFNLSMKGAA